LSCSEDRLVAFLSSELTETEALAFDIHLLSCEACWTAVQEDRQGSAVLQQLRGPAPTDLADRVRMTVAVAGESEPAPRLVGRAGRRTFASTIAALAATVALIAGVWIGVAGHNRSEPPQLAIVLAVAQSMAPSRPAGQGPTFVSQSQHIAVRFYRVEDLPVLVATSKKDFPMPEHMHMAGSTSSDWMATSGKLGIYCVNAQPGRQSVMVVAVMPVEALPRVAADLHLL
jgi:anti-sigma factor RsiW